MSWALVTINSHRMQRYYRHICTVLPLARYYCPYGAVLPLDTTYPLFQYQCMTSCELYYTDFIKFSYKNGACALTPISLHVYSISQMQVALGGRKGLSSEGEETARSAHLVEIIMLMSIRLMGILISILSMRKKFRRR